VRRRRLGRVPGRSQSADTSTRSLAAAVRRLFEALDARNASAFRRAFAAGATIVHDNGVETSVPVVARRLAADSDTEPHVRWLGRFRCGGAGPWAWVGYENRLTYSSGGRRLTLRFAETAILRRGRDGVWRFVRIHYSRIPSRKRRT
jgi:hypothetical protein